MMSSHIIGLASVGSCGWRLPRSELANCDAVDGSEIRRENQLIWRIYHDLRGIYTSKVVPDFWTINSTVWWNYQPQRVGWIPAIHSMQRVFHWTLAVIEWYIIDSYCGWEMFEILLSLMNPLLTDCIKHFFWSQPTQGFASTALVPVLAKPVVTFHTCKMFGASGFGIWSNPIRRQNWSQ